jgi:hypothetical protein
MTGEFSVAEFYDNDTHAYVGRWIDAKDAVYLAKHCIRRLHDNVVRIIITDGGDDCVFEWQRGKGITFPGSEADG